jgi:Protein kinase domain.
MAVKFIPKMKILRPELLDSEINIMKQINHPSIIQLYETLRQSIFVPLYGELFERISKVDHFSEQQACGLFF